MAFGCCLVTLASHVSLPFWPFPSCLLGFTYFCQAVRLKPLLLQGFRGFVSRQSISTRSTGFLRLSCRNFYVTSSLSSLKNFSPKNNAAIVPETTISPFEIFSGISSNGIRIILMSSVGSNCCGPASRTSSARTK